VDAAPYTDDLDIDAVRTREDLAALLRVVHVRADKPSLRTLEARTRHMSTPLSKTAAAEILKGVRFPRKAVMLAFLQACGLQEDGMEPWRRAWERVASTQEGLARVEAVPTAPSTEDAAIAGQGELIQLREQIERLTKANEQLRSRLAARSQLAEEGSQPQDGALGQETDGPLGRRSMWHFPDGSRITLVSDRVPDDRRPPSSHRRYLNYVRLSDLADLDSLVEIYGAIRAHNPTSRVVIMAAQDLTQSDVANHLVLVGGLTWQTINPWFSRIFPIPIEPGDPGERGAIVVRDPDDGERAFEYVMDGEELVEDVGFFACGENPSAPRRTLTICGGITTRGVHGAARCCIDWEMRQRNELYLMSQSSGSTAYCVVMRVPVVNGDPLTPDLSKKENRLFEWRGPATEMA
jgi:hypothetical protein